MTKNAILKTVSALAFCALLAPAAMAATTITMACGGIDSGMCQHAVKAWEKKSGNTVKIVGVPNSTTAQLSLYQQMLSAHSDKIDVFIADVIWPGLLGSQFADLSPYFKKSELKQYFTRYVENDTSPGGRLVAVPFFGAAGVLYYRKDLLKKYDQPVPKTWKQLTREAALIQKKERAAGNKKMWGFVWQGAAYEGLTCDALEWINSYGGGTIVNAKTGKVTIDNPQAVKALTLAKSWVGNISPESVLNMKEEGSRGIFQSGNAVFMRNWPYAYSLAEAKGSAIKGKVGVTLVPKGGQNGKHSAALGGWQLAISRYSKHKKTAISLVRFMVSKNIQKYNAINYSKPPIYKSLYSDKDVLKATPFFAKLRAVLEAGVARPSTVTKSSYNRVTTNFYTTVHQILSGQEKVKPGLKSLQGQLNRISRGGHWH